MDFSTFLAEMGDLSEAVVVSVEITNLMRDALVTIDLAIDPQTGLLVSDRGRRVLRVRLIDLRELVLRNGLNEGMRGPEANWGLNEIEEATAQFEGRAWRVEFRWSQDIRLLAFVCHRVEWHYAGVQEAEELLVRFYGSPDWD